MPSDLLDNAMKVARDMRTARVEALRPGDSVGDSDMAPIVEWYRGGETVAFGICDRVDRDLALSAACCGIVGFAADEVVLTLDAHVKILRPEDEPPRQGDLDRECHESDGCRLRTVSDCMVVQLMRRDGSWEYASMPFYVDPEALTIEWIDEAPYRISVLSSADGGESIEGYIYDVVSAAFAEPTILGQLHAVVAGLPAELAEAFAPPPGMTEQESADLVCIEQISRHGVAVMVTARSQEELTAKAERMAAYGQRHGPMEMDLVDARTGERARVGPGDRPATLIERLLRGEA